MPEETKPQSDEISTELGAQEETTTPEVTEFDLGNGVKVSKEVMNTAYNFHNRFSSYDDGDLESNFQETIRLKSWMAANPEKAEKVRQMVVAKAEAKKEDTGDRQPDPEVTQLQEDMLEWKFDKVVGNVEDILEKSGVAWDKQTESKVLSAIAHLNLPDNTRNMGTIVARYVLADILPNQLASKKTQTTAAKKGAFTEGSGGAVKPVKKPVTQMDNNEIREAIKNDIPDSVVT